MMYYKSHFLKTSIKIIIIFSLLLITIISCKKDDLPTTDTEYRRIAWNYLSKPRQKSVITKWEDAIVDKQTTYQGHRAVAVSFKTKHVALVGPTTVYIDPKTKKVIGMPIGF